MTPERWREISRIFGEAQALDRASRPAFVRRACGSDDALRREVEQLLAEPSDGPLVSLPPPVGTTIDVLPPGRLAGQQHGAFRLHELLGAGGMGEVYRAHDATLGRDVAIKILPAALTTHPDRLARFEREARVLAALNHPNIGAIFGTADIAGGPALVLELVAGETLAERLARGPLAIAEALDIARAIASGLEAAHEKGIIHRDLKPANVKITPDGTVKVLDFGLAKVSSTSDEVTPPQSAGVSVEGMVLGTPAYMSPEQARGRIVDKRTDVWAFGCVLYEMLTGHAAFRGETPSDTIVSVLERHADFDKLPAVTPPHVRRLLRRCLTKDSRERLRDMGDARLELEVPADEVTAAVAPRSSSAAIWWWSAAAAVTGAAVAALALWPGRFGGAAVGNVALEQVIYDAGLSATPAIAQDGQLLAYASDRAGRGDLDIWVQQAGGGTPLRVTDDPADDDAPDFAPDGKQMVFRSERGGGGVYLVPTLGGASRLIVPGGRRPRFSPDGTRLAFWTGQFRGWAPYANATVHVAALDGSAPARVAERFVSAHDPVWAPDGRSLVVLGWRDRATPAAEGTDWWWIPLDGRDPVRTGAFAMAPLTGLLLWAGEGAPSAWTARGVLFTANGDLWSLPVSMETGRAGVPERITVGTGRAMSPVSDRAGTIVFAVRRILRAIERVALTPLASAGPPTRLYTDNRDIAMRASQTADGATIVFEQFYRGYREIWRRDVASGEQQMVVRTESLGVTSPTVSPDGARIAYVVGLPDPELGDGYVVESDAGVPRRICERCRLGGFLSDNRRVLAAWDNNRVLGTIDARDGSRAELVRAAEGELNRPHASPDDRWLAFRMVGGSNKVLVTALSPGAPPPPARWQTVENPTTTGRPAGWSLDSRTLYLLLDTDGFRCLWGQQVSASGALAGAVFPVRHFHGGRMDDGGPSTSLGNPITPQGFLYERTETSGDIWRLVRPGR